LLRNGFFSDISADLNKMHFAWFYCCTFFAQIQRTYYVVGIYNMKLRNTSCQESHSGSSSGESLGLLVEFWSGHRIFDWRI